MRRGFEQAGVGWGPLGWSPDAGTPASPHPCSLLLVWVRKSEEWWGHSPRGQPGLGSHTEPCPLTGSETVGPSTLIFIALKFTWVVQWGWIVSCKKIFPIPNPWQQECELFLEIGSFSNSCNHHGCVCTKSLSHVWLFATPWTAAPQASLPMGFSRQEYWSGLPFPPPGYLPNPGIKPVSPALEANPLPECLR